ncbi:CdaR family protein [Enterococcus timonensis]|uniref:CdaR family protein n=1 Tax=Enterococcus timonensis TaxID=1852364 RepID=UPI0008D90373|nr:CdaR family protein [Enterococcus timonensis]
MPKVFRSNFFYSFIALLFALLLFFNANADSNTRITQSAQTYDATVYDVPINIDYDEDSYYISGFPDTVTVHLSSVNRVKLAQETNADTRSFKIVADLTKQTSGTMDVVLRTSNLTSGVEAVIDPAIISVTIETKVSKSFPVKTVVDESIVEDGYSVGEVTLDQDSVEVTTGEQTMTQIKEIQAKLNANRSTTEDFTEDVTLQAVDTNGNVLPVTIKPTTVRASVEVIPPEKEINVTFSQTGQLSAGIDRFTITSETQTVTVKGSNAALENLTQVEVPVDISSIRMQREVTVTIPTSDGLTFDPKTIVVTVVPVFVTGTSSATTTTPSSSSSTSSQSSVSSEMEETASLESTQATDETNSTETSNE